MKVTWMLFQDAQEFCKLFMSLLEDVLQMAKPEIKDIVKEQFQGQYSYLTMYVLMICVFNKNK